MIKNILVTLCVLGLTACSSSKNDSNKQVENENEEVALNACIEKGVKYYTDLILICSINLFRGLF